MKRHGYQRLLGMPATHPPRDPGCWIYSEGRVQIDLTRAPELGTRAGAIRLSGGELPVPLLVFRGDDGLFHAFCNRCGHRGRCLDPLDGTGAVQCCSIGRTTYDYHGHVLYGPGTRELKPYPVRSFADKLQIRVLPRFECRLQIPDYEFGGSETPSRAVPPDYEETAYKGSLWRATRRLDSRLGTRIR